MRLILLMKIGTTAVLSIARAIARNGVKFHQNIELVAFAGEEQGLYGSRAYARTFLALFEYCISSTNLHRRTSKSRCEYHTYDSSGHACVSQAR